MALRVLVSRTVARSLSRTPFSSAAAAAAQQASSSSKETEVSTSSDSGLPEIANPVFALQVEQGVPLAQISTPLPSHRSKGELVRSLVNLESRMQKLRDQINAEVEEGIRTHKLTAAPKHIDEARNRLTKLETLVPALQKKIYLADYPLPEDQSPARYLLKSQVRKMFREEDLARKKPFPKSPSSTSEYNPIFAKTFAEQPYAFRGQFASHPDPEKRMTLWRNCLRIRRPKLADEWHPASNAHLPWTPENVHYSSEVRVHWRCSVHPEHEWFSPISYRTRKKNPLQCPFCEGRMMWEGNSLAKMRPFAVKWWHPDLNGALTPQNIRFDSPRKVWWQIPGNERPVFDSPRNRAVQF